MVNKGLTNGFINDSRKLAIPKRNVNRIKYMAIVIIIVLIAGVIPFAVFIGSNNSISPVPLSTKTLAGMTLIYQHKDTIMPCTVGGCAPGIHAWNDASGADGKYGTVDDCAHCSCYCAPASIAMVSEYRGRSGNSILEDYIYDNGKSVGEVAVGDGIISTHGVGMLDIAITPEVQNAFIWSTGQAIVQNDSLGTGNAPLSGIWVIYCIDGGKPIIWCDHNGYPVNQSASYPSGVYKTEQGHCKVIAGYDDSGTPSNYADDWYLIYDPWPEYNDKNIHPLGAKLGPGGTYDPYWIPCGVVLGDAADIHLTDTFSIVPEHSLIIIPIITFMQVALFVPILKRKSK